MFKIDGQIKKRKKNMKINSFRNKLIYFHTFMYTNSIYVNVYFTLYCPCCNNKKDYSNGVV